MAASNINRVVLTGNLTADPEIRNLPSGTTVCNLRVAVNTRRKDASGGWVDKPNYFNVTVFGRQGETAGQYLAKGRGVAIDGRLEWREWEDKNGGGKRSAVDIIADTVQFLSSPGEGQGGGGGGYSQQPRESFTPSSDVPVDTGDFGPPQPAPVGGGVPDDDIPF